MSDQSSELPSPKRLRDVLLGRREPLRSRFIARQAYYPWFVVGITCIGAFIGQLDASIVQLTLPTLEREFDATLGSVSWVAIAYLVAFASILPIFGRLAEIVGRNLLYVAGCIASLILLDVALTGKANGLAAEMVLSALFGSGLGLFIAPNNDSTIHAVPAARSGEAGAMISLMRILGTALGVSASSSVLTWRLEVLAHAGGRTRTVPASALIAAVSDALMLLVAFAVIAGIASLVRSHHRAT